jgi:hypothetical protein
MPDFRLRAATALASLFLGAALCTAPSASGQAAPVAFKTNDVSVFAGYADVRPDFVPGWQSGEAFGLDLTRYFKLPVTPSIEGRVNLANGPLVNERTYLFGLKGQMAFRRFHPYADILVGIGDIHYNYAKPGQYLGDNTTVYSYGGGVDINAYNRFDIKLDLQSQHWDLGTNLIFEPTVAIVGVAYRVPFSRHVRQQDQP